MNICKSVFVFAAGGGGNVHTNISVEVFRYFNLYTCNCYWEFSTTVNVEKGS